MRVKKRKNAEVCVFEGCENKAKRVELPVPDFISLFEGDPKAKKAKHIFMFVCDEHEPMIVEDLRKQAKRERIKKAEMERGYA